MSTPKFKVGDIVVDESPHDYGAIGRILERSNGDDYYIAFWFTGRYKNKEFKQHYSHLRRPTEKEKDVAI